MKETKISKKKKGDIICAIVLLLVLVFALGSVYFLEYKPDRSRLNTKCYWELRDKLESDMFNEVCAKYDSSPMGRYWERGNVETLVCLKNSSFYEEIVLIMPPNEIEEQAKEKCIEYKMGNSFRYE